MPREDKLILSNASGTNPDVVVGLSAHYPFDWSAGTARIFGWRTSWIGMARNTIRIASTLSFDGGVYAAADTNEFRVLFIAGTFCYAWTRCTANDGR